MLEQAAGFAFLAALSPTALLIASAYLGSANPRRTLSFYLAGAVLMTLVIGIVALVALHAGALNHPRQRPARYGLRLGLGILALGAALFLSRRRPMQTKTDKKPGLVSRLVTQPAPATAFAVGLIVFAPSVTYLAAVQVIGTARASIELVVLALALVIAIVVALVWLPLVLHLVAPDATERGIKAIVGWLRANGRIVALTALAVAGVALVLDGAVGLAG